jgi:hypothetical protein
LYTTTFSIISRCEGSIFDEGPHKQAGGGSYVGGRVAELEENNAKLLAELKQTHLALVEADAAQNSLSINHRKLEEECAGLCDAVETLG